MTDRALHLAAGEYPWLPRHQPGSPDTQFTQVIDALKQQDEPAAAVEAAAAVLAAILGLLATFIVRDHGRRDREERAPRVRRCARVLAAGFQAHVTKPVEPVELTAAIAAVTDPLRDRAL
jgi:CheY-like chemotaxis protein